MVEQRAENVNTREILAGLGGLVYERAILIVYHRGTLLDSMALQLIHVNSSNEIGNGSPHRVHTFIVQTASETVTYH